MSKKKKGLVVLALLTLSLASCENPFALTSAASSDTTVYDHPTAQTYFRSINTAYGMHCGPTTGDTKMLVVPIKFASTSILTFNVADEEIKSNLQKTFFGTNEENTYWESVSTFYSKSSYSKMSISGSVSDPLTLNHSATYYNGQDAQTVTDSIATTVYNTLFTNGTYKLSDYDSDNDGFVDYLWLVYCYPYDQTGKSTLLWAYTSWDYSASHVANYSWASYNFVNEGLNSNGQDAHTFIHETGHQMGLDDYYSYDDVSHPRSPLGQLDMMDYNILDHNSFSKYLLNWIAPTIAEDDKEYTLKPFEDSGDALILASNLNGTVFDEYYIMEYYTPTGLNEKDVKNAYSNNIKGLDTYGLKIIHVDNRIGKFNYSKSQQGWLWDGKYYDNPDVINDDNVYYRPVNSNSKKYCYDDESHCLCAVVQASGSTDLVSETSKNHTLETTDLFTPTSNVFGKDVTSKTDEGWEIPDYLEVTSMNDQGITLKLTKK
jgi:M6 family metalloprotease-like protein